jgi:hypothetical protein
VSLKENISLRGGAVIQPMSCSRWGVASDQVKWCSSQIKRDEVVTSESSDLREWSLFAWQGGIESESHNLVCIIGAQSYARDLRSTDTRAVALDSH